MFGRFIRGDPYVLGGFVTKYSVLMDFSGSRGDVPTAGRDISQGGQGEDPPLANDIRTIGECSWILRLIYNVLSPSFTSSFH